MNRGYSTGGALMKQLSPCGLTLLAISILAVGCGRQKTDFVTIGTGGVTGLYYPTGSAIGRMINKRSKEFGLKATVESTAGSVFNINAVLSGDMEFGIAQSDRQYQAYHGLAEWSESGRQTGLRSVFSLHSEPVTLVVSEMSGIESLEDLAGKRINMGNPGSGQLQNSRHVLAAVGLTEGDISAEYVKAAEAPSLLQDERLDGFFYTVGHPNGNIKEATSGRIRVSITPIRGEFADRILQDYPYYSHATISRSHYPRALNTEDIETVSVKATMVTSEGVADDVVYALTKVVFEHLDDFKSVHPAYESLTREEMLTGLSAPIHPGAVRYYREAGFDKWIDPSLILE
jgi:TRAP transporter TAXI family solute receptor